MSSPRPIVDLAAACACGACTLRYAGEVVSMLICTCTDCQRATGTGHANIALVRRAGLSVTGTPASYASPADSGASMTRSFCPTCGTPLFAQSSRADSLAMLPVGLFGPDSAFYAPGQIIFARSHREWDLLPPDLPQHDTYRPGGRP